MKRLKLKAVFRNYQSENSKKHMTKSLSLKFQAKRIQYAQLIIENATKPP